MNYELIGISIPSSSSRRILIFYAIIPPATTSSSPSSPLCCLKNSSISTIRKVFEHRKCFRSTIFPLSRFIITRLIKRHIDVFKCTWKHTITYAIFAPLNGQVATAQLPWHARTSITFPDTRNAWLIHPVGFTDRKIYSNLFRPIFYRARGTALRFLLFKVWMDMDDDEEEEGKGLIRS